MRSALGRARRLVLLLLLALSAWYVFLRRRVAPVAVAGQPGAGPLGGSGAGRDQLGAPGELPDDVLATDAGLTELPDAAGEPPTGLVVVDEVRVDQVLATGPAGEPELIEIVRETVTLAEITDLPEADAGTAAPAESAPAESVPVESVPVESVPVESVPVESVPVESVPVESVPVESVPVESVPEAAPLSAPEVAAGGQDGIEEPTNEIPRPAFVETPSPAFSEAPTMEMPVLMDDLRAVRGIGPSMERMLHGLGIVSFRQLALLDGAELERVRHELRDFRSRIEREDWMGQARQLHKGKYGTDPA